MGKWEKSGWKGKFSQGLPDWLWMIPSELVTSKPRATNYNFLAFSPASDGWNFPKAAVFSLEKVPVVTRSVGSVIYVINNKKGCDFLLHVLPDCWQWRVASREKGQG